MPAHQLANAWPHYIDLAREATDAEQYEDKIKSQEYGKLKEMCLQEKTLFTDDLFAPAKYGAHFAKGKLAGKKIDWLRPGQFVSSPHFFLGTVDRFDVNQGKLSDCWLISAISDLTMRPKLFGKVVPNQSYTDDYAGIFYFQFYQYGQWISVVVDDLLPTHEGELILGHSNQKNEFWIALLEKAYAKLNGGYEALNFGQACEAFVDFTGGVSEYFKLNDDQMQANLFSVLYRYYLRSSLICVYIDRNGEAEEKLANGLVTKHSYSISSMKRIRLHGRLVNLLRLRNPWGAVEWNGPWSDQSPEWNNISEDMKHQIGLKVDNDGEFWMAFEDFVKHFNVFECCHLIDHSADYYWRYYEFFGDWDSTNWGGCVDHKETFPSNPQYLLTLTEKDVDEDDDLCTVLISLSQKYYRFRKTVGGEHVTIGFVIYLFAEPNEQFVNKQTSVEKINPAEQVGRDFFRHHLSIARVDYLSKRENCGRFRLKQGQYLIIPTTYESEKAASFMLRVLVSRSKEDKQSYRKKNAIQEITTDQQAGFAAKQADTKHSKSPKDGKKHQQKKSAQSTKSNKSVKSPKGSPAANFVTVGSAPKPDAAFKLAHTLDPLKMHVEKVNGKSNSSKKKNSTPKK